MLSIGAIFTSTYHKKQLNQWPNSSVSCVVNYNQLSICQGEIEPFEDHSSTHGHLTSLRNKPKQSNLGNFQYKYLPELLVNVYSYHLMVKLKVCLAVACVEASFSQIWTHIFVIIIPYVTLLWKNQPNCRIKIWYFEKYQFQILKPLWFSCIRL